MRPARPQFPGAGQAVRARAPGRRNLQREASARRSAGGGEILADSREQLIEYFLPLVERNPPDALLGQITTPEPTKDQIEAWLRDELSRVFPEPSDLIREM